MTSRTPLNHGRKCMQELEQFNHWMGWTFRNLDSGNNSNLYDSRDDSDATHTVFGNIVNIPIEFVPPTSTSSSASRRTRKTKVQSPSRIFRKRGTGPAASSTAKTHPVDSHLSTTDESCCSSTATKQSKRRAHKTLVSKTVKQKSEPVDFVYDINVRRRLREQVDSERHRVLQAAKAREAQLRAENKWVFDGRDKSPPRRQQAWQPSFKPRKMTTNRSEPNLTRNESKRPHSTRSSRVSAPSRSSRLASSSSTNSLSSSQRSNLNDTKDDVEAAINDFERRLHVSTSPWTR